MCGGGAVSGATGGAASGALVGSVVPGVGTIAGAAVGGGLGLLSGMAGDRSAELQGQIAQAQLEEQRRTRQQALDAAGGSPQELAQLDQSIQLNNQDIARKQKLLDSSDPALIEAGHQALSLLQGKESSVLAPLKTQRDKDRLQLENQLRSQLGSGYANTTAGIQALSAFDQASASTYSSAQQQSLSQLLGVAQNTSASYGMQNNISNANNISNSYGNIQARKVGAINGTPITGAGAQYAGALAGATQQQSTFNQLLGLGGQLGGAYLGAQAATAAKKT
jgi:hypothetical protein